MHTNMHVGRTNSLKEDPQIARISGNSLSGFYARIKAHFDMSHDYDGPEFHKMVKN